MLLPLLFATVKDVIAKNNEKGCDQKCVKDRFVFFKSKIDPCAVCGQSDDQFSVVHDILKMDSWQMCKMKES